MKNLKSIMMTLLLVVISSATAFSQTPRPSPGPVIFPEQAVSPASPPAGYSTVFVDNTGVLKVKNSAGTITTILTTFPAESGNKFLASPVDGSLAVPTFRVLSGADITTGTINTARLGSGTADNTTYLRGDNTWATISSGGFALQTETTFTNNNTPAIYLKSLTPNTTRFLRFNDNSGASMLSVYSDGAVESASSIYSGSGIFATTGTSITLRTAGSINVGVFREYGSLSFEGAQPSTSGVPKAWLDFNGVQANTGITASTEYNAFWYNPPRTYTWNAGGITNQRFFYLRAPTLAFGGASTVSNAATFTVSGAPIAGTNATISNSYALWIASGTSQFDGNVSLGSSNVLLLGGATSPGTATRFQLGTPTTANNNVNVYLEPTATTATAIAIQGNSSQTADLFQTFNSAGTKTFFINSKGTAGGAPGSVATSTVFGYEALNGTTAGNEITAFGYRAGYSATSGIDYNVFFGASAGASLTSGAYNVLIGAGVLNGETSISNSVIIGQAAMSQSSATYTGAGPVFAVGRNAGTDLTTQQNIAVFGSYLAPFNDWYFGESYSTASPSDITFQPSVATGTNTAGSSFYLKGGAGTGNATPGKLYLQYASAGSSGTTLQSYTTAVTIDSTATDVTGLLVTDQLKGSGSVNYVARSGAGTGPTIALTTGSNQVAGEISVTTGTSSDLGIFVSVTYGTSYSTAPFVVLTPSNSASANLNYYVASGTGLFTIYLETPPSDATEYKFMYHVVQ